MAIKRGSELRTLEVNALTSRDRRERISTALADWHSSQSTPPSIDVLLARPIEFLEMSTPIARELGTIPKPVADKFMRLIAEMLKHPDAVEAINEVGARAMNDRKRGLLKPHKNGRAK